MSDGLDREAAIRVGNKLLAYLESALADPAQQNASLAKTAVDLLKAVDLGIVDPALPQRSQDLLDSLPTTDPDE